MADVDRLREQLSAMVYQLLIARSLADVIFDLLVTAGELERQYAINRLDWLRKWITHDFASLDQASERFRSEMSEWAKALSVDVGSMDRMGRAAAGTPRAPSSG